MVKTFNGPCSQTPNGSEMLEQFSLIEAIVLRYFITILCWLYHDPLPVSHGSDLLDNVKWV